MTNKYRNELKIKLDTTEYLLRGTFACLVEIESAVSKTIAQILDLASDNAMPLSYNFDIIKHGVIAADPDVDKEQFELDFSNTSIADSNGWAIQFLIQAIEIPNEIKKK